MMIKPKTSRCESLRFSNFGFSTILLSFVMICVVSFSALSLMTAYSDYKLSQKVASKTTQYYEAKETAYETLQELDRFLCNAYLFSASESEYYETVRSDLSFEDTYSFTQPIAEGQYLLVEIAICYPKDAEDGFYEILQWRSVYEIVEFEDEYLNLMQ